ncbi:dopamine receptor 4-like [Choristoneura fumiferana]|uniref:dopamine receptor 4-like n=1 Tax=Choristoneura fumiferana TaxID=7141 RepID=UPI003D158747
MENNTLPAVINFATNETLFKQVANFFNVSVANVKNQSEVAQENLFDLYEAYKTREKEQLFMYKTVAYAVGTLIILSNLTVVISSGLILRKGQQPKSTYLLLGNVSLADTIIGFSIVFGELIGNSMNSNLLCIFQIGMIVCPTMVSIFSVGLIAVDRYFYILHGLYYQRYFNTTRVRIGILIIWMIGLTLGFLPVTGWVNTQHIFSRCYYTALFPASLIFFNSCLSIIPIILVTVLYSIVLVRALRNVRDIKTAQKSVHVNSNSDEAPKLRMHRGNTNMNRNSGAVLTKVDQTKIRRCTSFHDFDKGNFSNKSEKSKSINDLCKDKAKSTDDVNDSTNGKEVYTNLHDESKCSIYTIESSYSGPSILYSGSKNESPNKCIVNIFHKTKSPAKPKEPNKWRAITVVMLTTGSFLFTWLPFFIILIFYVFCEEKLTNPRCIYYRTLLVGPLATLAFLNSILNPLIYAWWHKGFQNTVRNLIRKYWCINMPLLSNSA